MATAKATTEFQSTYIATVEWDSNTLGYLENAEDISLVGFESEWTKEFVPDVRGPVEGYCTNGDKPMVVLVIKQPDIELLTTILAATMTALGSNAAAGFGDGAGEKASSTYASLEITCADGDNFTFPKAMPRLNGDIVIGSEDKHSMRIPIAFDIYSDPSNSDHPWGWKGTSPT